MRNPFEKEFREKYGLNMTPGKLMIRNGSGKLPDIDILDDKGGGGGRRRRRIKTVKATGARPEPDTEPNARLPRLSKTGGRRTIPKKSPYVTVPSNGSARRCIVKVDMRNYAETTTGGRLGNKKYIATRLEPFVKNTVANSTGGNNWAKVAYIGRDEALDGKLFSCSETGSLVGWDGQTAIESFGTDPTLTVILSPEDPGADLIELTRRFMEDTYRSNAPEPPRLWVAGIHGNTKHRHVHILVSCKGVNGGDAKVSPSAIYRLRLKDGAEKILTEIQGHRGWAEEAEAQRRNRKPFEKNGKTEGCDRKEVQGGVFKASPGAQGTRTRRKGRLRTRRMAVYAGCRGQAQDRRVRRGVRTDAGRHRFDASGQAVREGVPGGHN